MMGDPSSNSKWSKYSVEDGKLIRKGVACEYCGPGVFMAVHSDRTSCGQCGHTIYAGKNPANVSEDHSSSSEEE